MSSLVTDLQKDIISGGKKVTEILRTAKLISAKLGLTDIATFIDRELNGYTDLKTLPAYRRVQGGTLYVRNPAYGWVMAGHVSELYAISDPVSVVEDMAQNKEFRISPHDHISVSAIVGDDYLVNQFPQSVGFSGSQLKKILEAIKDEILKWTLELEKRGIIGQDMTFNEKEKQSAVNQTFHIQQFTGVIGDVKNSSVQIYNYSTIHQTLKQLGVSQNERNELENVMDTLAKATPAEKPKHIEKAKAWIVKNEEFLGASVGLVRKALGLDVQ